MTAHPSTSSPSRFLPGLALRPARTGDAPTLTTIAFATQHRSGYPETWLQFWREELTITEEHLAASHVTLATIAGRPVGFSAYRLCGGKAVLQHLRVIPSVTRLGIGRALFAAAEKEVRAAGALRLILHCDPWTEGFYRRMGAVRQTGDPLPDRSGLVRLEKILG